MQAVVVALGKIGLPVAAHIALAGHDVVGCDVDPRVVEAVNAGREPWPGEAGLQQALEQTVAAGRLRATTDTTAAIAQGADLIVAVPPLMVDNQARPDYGALDGVIADIGRGLKPGAVISVETTLPVGTTRSRLAPALAEASGLRAEEDFFTVHSPERVYSGRIFKDLETYPKLVGGLTDAGERRAVALYSEFLGAEICAMGSAEAAELTKLAETTYRDVNIALANEFAKFADRSGIDIKKVIAAANTQPFSHLHHPGIAVGGHCIPVYPRFFLSVDPEARLPAVAREINESMPAYAIERLDKALGAGVAGTRVVILGVTYRGDVKVTAFSGAFGAQRELERRGASVLAADPLYSPAELRELGFEPWDGEVVDAAIVQADHRSYAQLTPRDLPGVRAILDGRGMLDAAAWSAAGVKVLRIGAPT